ncbi:MAG: acetoacetate--CoA ligase [Armatimonadetes bacterium]|nr:acetoacetate--CoA ligase [Armatimonadota bacterium]
MPDTPLWTPTPEAIEYARITAFTCELERRSGEVLGDYSALHKYSVEHKGDFWSAVWDFCEVIASTDKGVPVSDEEQMPGARFFPDARLNYAENLLRDPDDREAIDFWGEGQVRSRLTRRQLYDHVSQLVQAFQKWGMKEGDRVAAILHNGPEAVVGLLAASSIGAVWSSCSPDFGVQGILDRFGQIEPKILIVCDGYFYGGKRHDVMQKLPEVLRGLPTVERVVVVEYGGSVQSDLSDMSDLSDLCGPPDLTDSSDKSHEASTRIVEIWSKVLSTFTPRPIRFAQLPFNHPLYILYSSGTTGVPKCIVHGAGGSLLQHLKEHQLHCDIRKGDRVFYFTTCGWMMWNWLTSALASEAVLILYDGSPFFPDGNVLFSLADAESMTLFGTSAKYIASVEKAGLKPMETHDLSSVRTMTSTGSPLAPESFEYVYRAIKRDIHLASISGGTDIVSCFMLGNPTLPVWKGEIQCLGLGMDVDVVEETGASIRGEKGELVCRSPFPSMPLGFWNDPDGKKYQAAYFEHFPGLWRHGDWAEITGHGGVVMHGRSDSVLNPGGVRIGTSEIYRQVEQLDEIVEALVVGQQWQGDERVVLFVRLREGVSLSEDLIAKIKSQIRKNTTPRHVPAIVVQVSDIPRTRSGKIVELAVREVIHGRPVKNVEAIANPEALDAFQSIAQGRLRD